MLDQFVSVTRATLKGTILTGIAQGVMGGLAFWVVGIDGAIFWGTVMTALSIIPGIGSALVWAPAAIILMVTGEVWRGIGLAAFGGIVIGSIDNLLRPLLVGHDTQMHELMIFFSTLGGLLMFGVMGFIVGPILAALFVTVWEMFAAAFRSSIAEHSALVDVPLAGVLHLTNRPPHVLERFHVLERDFHRLGGCVHGLHRRVTGLICGAPCFFGSGPR